MEISQILILLILSVAVRIFGRKQQTRSNLILIISVLVVFWLQPAISVRNLSFWLPLTTLVISILGWMLTIKAEQVVWTGTLKTLGIVFGLVILLGIARYINIPSRFVLTTPPRIVYVLAVVAIVGLILSGLTKTINKNHKLLGAGIVVLIVILLILKIPVLEMFLIKTLRFFAGQSTDNYRISEITIHWLGFSYIVFRMIHTFRDRLSGRLPYVSLQEYLIYIIFFPTITAGPIDRLPRFINDLRRDINLSSDDVIVSGKRFVIGVFKKFVVADSLALIALNQSNAWQVNSTFWMWVVLYAYAILILMDFSGYTDIAIGLGNLAGFHLPENFSKPYVKPNLTHFWNNWHMTLTQWFRAYYFNPFTRYMKKSRMKISSGVILLIGQTTTMVLIGMWHGVTANFILWGLWHGLGLFIQNRWSDWIKIRLSLSEINPAVKQLIHGGSVFLTFHYIVLGWVWFALPSVSQSFHVLKVLFGLT